MAKTSRAYVCQSCGTISARWAGRCSGCDEWNTLVEEAAVSGGVGAGPKAEHSKGATLKLEGLSGEKNEAPRMATGFDELDRVTGGGLVPGSAILVGGDPGIGKSTLLLQLAARLASSGRNVLYFSGEEATAQIRLRADRLGVSDAPVKLASETNLSNILTTIEEQGSPDLVIVDSIQTLWSDILESSPGTVSQVRSCSQALIRVAKKSNTTLVIVGHVTKDGNIAGPKVVEHMVDTVLYFEGDKGYNFRILRSIKNRFGATDEIGVFEMASEGLLEVANPSELFLGDREEDTTGCSVFAGMEGTRPILVEIQALVAESKLATPRRAVIGWDSNRLSMILAVLDAHCRIKLGGHDVYLNVAGGLKINEPGADLAVAAALVSSLANVPISPDSVFFGEVSLSGAVRSVGQMPSRLKEARKLGFSKATIPASGKIDKMGKEMSIKRLGHLKDAASMIIGA